MHRLADTMNNEPKPPIVLQYHDGRVYQDKPGLSYEAELLLDACRSMTAQIRKRRNLPRLNRNDRHRISQASSTDGAA
jgi:hypothetical protein